MCLREMGTKWCFRAPLAETVVTRGEQASGEIDESGPTPSLIRDVAFQGFGICFGRAAFPHFQQDINTLLVHLLLNDW